MPFVISVQTDLISYFTALITFQKIIHSKIVPFIIFKSVKSYTVLLLLDCPALKSTFCTSSVPSAATTVARGTDVRLV